MIGRLHSFADKLGLVILIGILAAVFWNLRGVGRDAPVAHGTPMPPLEAQGWLNVPAGGEFNPDGKIVVVDCWATWCGPCRAELPKLALAAAHYRPLGVEFVSVTQETRDDLEKIKQVIATTPGFDWPAAYGGFDFFGALDIKVIPTYIVFGRDGRARWSGVGSDGLERALDEALAAAR